MGVDYLVVVFGVVVLATYAGQCQCASVSVC